MVRLWNIVLFLSMFLLLSCGGGGSGGGGGAISTPDLGEQTEITPPVGDAPVSDDANEIALKTIELNLEQSIGIEEYLFGKTDEYIVQAIFNAGKEGQAVQKTVELGRLIRAEDSHNFLIRGGIQKRLLLDKSYLYKVGDKSQLRFYLVYRQTVSIDTNDIKVDGNMFYVVPKVSTTEKHESFIIDIDTSFQSVVLNRVIQYLQPGSWLSKEYPRKLIDKEKVRDHHGFQIDLIPGPQSDLGLEAGSSNNIQIAAVDGYGMVFKKEGNLNARGDESFQERVIVSSKHPLLLGNGFVQRFHPSDGGIKTLFDMGQFYNFGTENPGAGNFKIRVTVVPGDIEVPDYYNDTRDTRRFKPEYVEVVNELVEGLIDQGAVSDFINIRIYQGN